MNSGDLTKLVSGLKLCVPKPFESRLIEGNRGHLKNMRKIVNSLILKERLEIHISNGMQSKAYTERLISDAIRYGDQHKPTMELADFYLEDKSAIHKLFKVLVPRYKDYKTEYVRLLKAPCSYYDRYYNRVVVELRGHPFPELRYESAQPNKNHIHNVLLFEAKKEYRIEKYRQAAFKQETDSDT